VNGNNQDQDPWEKKTSQGRGQVEDEILNIFIMPVWQVSDEILPHIIQRAENGERKGNSAAPKG
jgi:hypothetical protein